MAIVWFLCCKRKLNVNDAIELFSQRRHGGIYKQFVIDALVERFYVKPQARSKPEWIS